MPMRLRGMMKHNEKAMHAELHTIGTNVDVQWSRSQSKAFISMSLPNP